MSGFFGFIMMAMACAGAFYCFIHLPKQKRQHAKEKEMEDESLPSDTETRPDKKLKVAKSGQTISFLGEDERQILASISLYEMTQVGKGAPWTKTGAVSKILSLAGGIFIFKMPSMEGGKPTWLKAEEIETLPLGSFFVGSQESPGPGRIFYRKNQAETVDYELPNGLTPGVTWQVVDIGTLDVDVDGESENFIDDDRLYFVTSTEKGGTRRLLNLDARKGEAKGAGGLFLCEPFEPSVDIKEIL